MKPCSIVVHKRVENDMWEKTTLDKLKKGDLYRETDCDQCIRSQIRKATSDPKYVVGHYGSSWAIYSEKYNTINKGIQRG